MNTRSAAPSGAVRVHSPLELEPRFDERDGTRARRVAPSRKPPDPAGPRLVFELRIRSPNLVKLRLASGARSRIDASRSRLGIGGFPAARVRAPGWRTRPSVAAPNRKSAGQAVHGSAHPVPNFVTLRGEWLEERFLSFTTPSRCGFSPARVRAHRVGECGQALRLDPRKTRARDFVRRGHVTWGPRGGRSPTPGGPPRAQPAASTRAVLRRTAAGQLISLCESCCSTRL